MRSISDKKGMASSIKGLIGVVVVLVLVGALATTALIPLFNSTAYTGIPAWVPTTLGILGVVAFIFVILRTAGK